MKAVGPGERTRYAVVARMCAGGGMRNTVRANSISAGAATVPAPPRGALGVRASAPPSTNTTTGLERVLAGAGVLFILGAVSAAIAETWSVYALLALGAASLAAWFFVSWRNNRVFAVQDAARNLGVPLYAVTPRLTRSALRRLPPDRRTLPDYVLERPESRIAASFRRIARIGELDVASAAPVIAVTAPMAREGGAAEALALARTLAADGKNVIAVDCDLRLRRLTELAGASAPHGVGEVLDGQSTWRDAIVGDENSHAHLLCAVGGDARPALFETSAFQHLLTELRENYDFVVVSAPSLLGLAVTPVIMNRASLCVVVLRVGVSNLRHARAALRLLWKFNAGPASGLLLTNAPEPAGDPLR